MLKGDEEERAHMQLFEEDFPANYVNMAHPDDGEPLNHPLPVQCIEHVRSSGNHRLLLRVSFKLDTGMYVPFSFVVDTGAPRHLYLANDAIEILKAGNRLFVGDELGSMFMKICNEKFRVVETPQTHKPANIIGLKALQYLGFGLLDFDESKNQDTKFGFFKDFLFF